MNEKIKYLSRVPDQRLQTQLLLIAHIVKRFSLEYAALCYTNSQASSCFSKHHGTKQFFWSLLNFTYPVLDRMYWKVLKKA